MAKPVGKWKTGQAVPKASPACNPPAADSIAGRHCGGQATVEYAIVAGVMVAVVAIMSLLLTTFGDYGERILEMIASDYP